jgi:hypothetical protein
MCDKLQEIKHLTPLFHSSFPLQCVSLNEQRWVNLSERYREKGIEAAFKEFIKKSTLNL